jgi:hypothetical protein
MGPSALARTRPDGGPPDGGRQPEKLRKTDGLIEFESIAAACSLPIGCRPYVPRYNHCMPHLLESGKLQLSREEASAYRAAADRLHEACEMALDLEHPITVEDWMFLEITRAAHAGDFAALDAVIAKVAAELESRTLHS